MKILIKNKILLLVVAIFVIAMFLYNTFLKSDPLPTPDALSASSIGDDLLKIREELQQVTFDQTLLASPGYLFLVDFSTVVPTQVTGRRNPFDIIGRD